MKDEECPICGSRNCAGASEHILGGPGFRKRTERARKFIAIRHDDDAAMYRFELFGSKYQYISISCICDGIKVSEYFAAADLRRLADEMDRSGK